VTNSSDVVALTRATYAEIANEYARGVRPFVEQPDDIGWFVGVVSVGATVAEIGCGPGHELRALRDAGLCAVGFDLSPQQMQAGGLAGGAAPVAVADMRALPIRADGVAGIWCQAALLHVPHAYVPQTLAEFARAVRAGGALFLSVAEGDGEGWQTGRFDHPRWFTGHREDRLRGLLGEAGFDVVHARHTSTHRDWLTLHAVRR
jgi:SAM-dependent methyltransferase